MCPVLVCKVQNFELMKHTLEDCILPLTWF